MHVIADRHDKQFTKVSFNTYSMEQPYLYYFAVNFDEACDVIFMASQ